MVQYFANAGSFFLEIEESITTEAIFDVHIPLSLLFGFAEDYRKIIVNTKHELILTRANSDANAILRGATLEKILI